MKRDYDESGYVVVRGFFPSEEIDALCDESQRLLSRMDLISEQNLRCRFMPDVSGRGRLFEVFDPVIDLGPRCASISRDPRLLRLLAALLGEPVCLFKDKLIFKPPGAKGYDLHQDYPANWPGFPQSFVTVVIPIDAFDGENGCTEVFRGAHRAGQLMPDDVRHAIPEGIVDETTCVPLKMEPGDLAVFGAFMPHRSAPNRSPRNRRALYLSYNARSDGGDQRDRHYTEFHDWMRLRLAAASASADSLFFR